jgi:hypothetical protein
MLPRFGAPGASEPAGVAPRAPRRAPHLRGVPAEAHARVAGLRHALLVSMRWDGWRCDAMRWRDAVRCGALRCDEMMR